MRDALHACSHRARVLPHLSMCSVTKTEKQLAMSTNELTSLELDGRSPFFLSSIDIRQGGIGND